MAAPFEIDIMSMDDANRLLNKEEKELLVKRHNLTANLFILIKGKIKKVPSQGWWY